MNRQISYLQHVGTHIINIESPVVNAIFKRINSISYFCFFLLVFCFYGLGIWINRVEAFPQFNVFQVLFISIFVISFLSVRYYEGQMKECHRLMAGDKQLQPINDKVHRLRRSRLNLIVPPVVGAFFGILAVILININIKTLSAAYLIITYILCVLISFLGYLQYIYLAIYIWKLSHITNNIQKYNKDYPSNTNWLISLTRLYSKYRNIFFVLGCMYVFGVIYFVLCDSFKVVEKISYYPLMNIPLLMFWGGVVIAIVIFFPVTSVIEYLNIKKIINQLKEQSVVSLNRNTSDNKDNEHVKIHKSYLVIAIMNTPDYPFKDSFGIAFSGFITCVNLAASIVAIINFPSV